MLFRAFFLALTLFVAGAVPVTPPPTTADAIDEIIAPDFTLQDMQGKPFKLSEHKDKIVVLNFWATWCPPCRREIPDFIKIQEEMRDKGVLFVGVSLDEEGFEVVRPYAEKMQINYPLLVDDGRVARLYGGIASLPTTFLIKEGKVVWGTPGMLSETVLRERLDLLLE